MFKTAWFSRAADKAGVGDEIFCEALRDGLSGRLLVNLGGGAYKKRLLKNQYRSILPCRCGPCRVDDYLSAKNERDNIGDAELNGYKVLAKAHAGLADVQRNDLLSACDLLEICHAHEACAQSRQRTAGGDACVGLIRVELRMSQPVFARLINAGASTVQKWESGQRQPGGTAQKLLYIIKKHGAAVLARRDSGD